MDATDEAMLLDEFSIGSGRGGRKPREPVTVEVVRGLTADDLPRLLSPPTLPAKSGGTVREMRTAHHQLAQALASGKDQNEVALITGYSPAWISNLKSDPAFAELLEYYKATRELVFIDVIARMRALGITALDELQARLANESDKWSKREVMELAELMLIKGREIGSTGAGGAGGPGVTVNVSFVKSEGRALLDVTPELAK